TLRQPPYPVLALQAKPSALFSSGNWQTASLFTFATLMIVGIVCWICWARNLVRPLRHLLLFLGKLQRGTLSGLEKRVLLTGYQEAAVIGNEFNNLLEKTRLLTAELVRANSALYEKELLARQAELSHLRSQINPHFLYNTLETMVGIAYVNGQPALAEIARALGHLFAFSIKGGDTVTLEAEFQIARDYLHIQRFRFSDRFDVCYDVSDACLQKMVPKMILQPLIENAIVHGIESQDRFCHLRVGAALAQDALCLTVTDDGAGMSEHTLLSIRARLQDDASAVQDSSHNGLFNVDRRIKLLYGRLYGITLASVQDHGTTVTITLPMPKEDCACTKCSL
ncbi:MAG: sensor histidine kinase, partial [Clostridia bacterium]